MSRLRQGVVDEVRILVNPLVLGSGIPMFKDADRTALRLLKTETFSSGVVVLTSRPV